MVVCNWEKKMATDVATAATVVLGQQKKGHRPQLYSSASTFECVCMPAFKQCVFKRHGLFGSHFVYTTGQQTIGFLLAVSCSDSQIDRNYNLASKSHQQTIERVHETG